MMETAYRRLRRRQVVPPSQKLSGHIRANAANRYRMFIFRWFLRRRIQQRPGYKKVPVDQCLHLHDCG